MTNIDLAFFLVAGITGIAPVDGRIPWLIITVWSLLKLLHVLS